MSFLDPITAGGPATELVTTGDVPVNVSQSEPPHPGDVLIAVDATHATWQALTGGGSGTASALATSGAPVNVGGSTPPSAGNVLVATGPTAATWQPGLALTSAAPSQVSVTAAVPGVATTVARADHVHSVATAAPAALTVGGVQSAGAATSLSRSDHEHAMPALATSVAAGFLSASDKLRLDGMATGAAALTSSAASTVGTTNTVGVATAAARADHVHAHGSQTDGTLHATATAIAAGFLSGADKSKLDGVAAGATNTTLSSTAAASVGATNTVGVGTTAARADHVHAHGVQTDWTLHADATPTVAGFLSAADKTRLDGMTTGSAAVGSTAATQVSVTTAAAGSLATAARSDHVHSVSTGAPSALAIGSVQDAGAATSLSRSDHVHAMPVGGAPSGLTLTGTNSTGVAATVALSDHVHALPASSTVPSALTVAGTGSAGSSTSISKADHVHAMPGLATSLADGFMSAADKAKFDTFDAKESCRLASTTNITLSGFPVVDGVTPAAGERVLVTGQTAASANGIYVAATGAWSRSADADISTEVTAGLTVRVNEGTAFADTLWILTTNDPIVLGTTALVFAQAPSVADKVKLDGIAAGAAALTNSPASTVGTANTVGVGTTAARTDHVHAHGAQVDGTLHAAATTSVAGFLSTADKTKLDAIEAGAQVVTFSRVQTALGAATSPVGFNAQRITGVADPTSAQDVATKAYTDSIAQGLDTKASVRLVATSNVPTLSGAVVIDGVTTAADRVLLTAQTAGAANGLYLTNAGGAWARTTDADTSAKVTSGMYVFATEGTANADSGWALITPDPIVLGTTALTFTQVSGAGQIVAGAGLTKTGNTLNVVANADASIVVASDDIKVGVLATDAQHGVRGSGTLHAAVTTTTNGFMLATDKVRLDAMATGATNTPLATLASPAVGNTAAAVGVGTTAARQDHTHLVSSGTPVALAIAGTNTQGTAATLALSDHVHALPSAGTPLALTLAGANAPGSAATLSRSDHVHALPASSTAPPALTVGGSSAAGSSTSISKADHVHALAAPTVVLENTGLGSLGVSTAAAREDHQHPAVWKAPAVAMLVTETFNPSTPPSTADGVTIVTGDRIYVDQSPISGIYVSLGSTWSLIETLDEADVIWVMSRDTLYRGSASGSAVELYPYANYSSGGLLASIDYAKLAAIQANAAAVTSAAPTQITVTTAAAGSSSSAARGDHVHSVATAAPASLGIGSLQNAGTSTSLARADHVHAMPDTNIPSSLTISSTQASGVAPTISRSDHVHGMPGVGTPLGLTVGGANAVGSATTLVRSDHVHALPAFGTTGGTFCQGSDSRLADDRTASGLRTASTIVATATAAAPSAGQVLVATGSAAATWQSLVIDPAVNGFRISDTADDSSHADSSALTTVYLAPYKSDRISLYTGSTWITVTATGVSYVLAGRTANIPFDVFAYWTGSTVALEVLNWTSGSARATGLARQNGVYVKAGDSTRRYLGSVRPRSATTFKFVGGAFLDDGVLVGCDLWNVDNRKPLALQILGPSSGYAYASTTVRQLAANANAQLDVITGIGGLDAGVATRIVAIGSAASTNATAVKVRIGIGVNTTTSISGRTGEGSVGTGIPADVLMTELTWSPPSGLTSYAWLEAGNTGVSFAGTGGGGSGPSVPAMEALTWY